ncbi:MAG: hypothetical protein KDA89_11300, partial [Planctomycetaceae bacterium]|nr:hypothetical protein [Planctomycetaceae bacterium]
MNAVLSGQSSSHRVLSSYEQDLFGIPTTHTELRTSFPTNFNVQMGPLYALMLENAALADDFDTKDYVGQYDNGNRRGSTSSTAVQFNAFSSAELNQMADVLVPKAIQSTAELLRVFYALSDTEAPTLTFESATSGTEDHPAIFSSDTVTLNALASDQETGDTGVGQFRVLLSKKSLSGGSWSSPDVLNASVLQIVESAQGRQLTLNLSNLDPAFLYRVELQGEDGAGNDASATTFLQFGGRTGDVLELDLGISGGNVSSIRLEGVQGPNADLIYSLVPNTTRPLSDFSVVGRNGTNGTPTVFGTVVLDNRGANSAFAKTGRLFFAPSTADGLNGDASEADRGLQGEFSFLFSYIESGTTKTRDQTVIIRDGYSNQGESAVEAQTSLKNNLRLQQRLNYLGYTDYEGKILAVDGIIGPRTESAIRLFKAATSSVADAVPSGQSHDLSDVQSRVVDWLNAADAPVWKQLPEKIAVTESDTRGQFRYGVAPLVDVISGMSLSAGALISLSPRNGVTGSQFSHAAAEFNGRTAVFAPNTETPKGDILNAFTTAVNNKKIAAFNSIEDTANNRLTITITLAEATVGSEVSPTFDSEASTALVDGLRAFADGLEELNAPVDSSVTGTDRLLAQPLGLLGSTAVADSVTSDAADETQAANNQNLADADFSLADGLLLPEVFNEHLIPAIEGFFAQNPTATSAEFKVFLTGYKVTDSESNGYTISNLNLASVDDSSSTAGDVLEFEFILNTEIQQTRSLSLPGFAGENLPTADVITTASLPLKIRIDLNEASPDAGFRIGFGAKNSGKINFDLKARNLQMPDRAMISGVLGLSVGTLPQGEFLNVAAEYTPSTSLLSASQLLTGALAAKFGTLTLPAQAITLNLPVSVATSSYLNGSATINLAAATGGIFGNDPVVSFTDLDANLKKLTSSGWESGPMSTSKPRSAKPVDVNDLVGMLDQFGGWLAGLSNSDFLNQGFDLLEGTSLSDSLGLTDAWQDALSGLYDDGGAVRFDTVQEFLSLLGDTGILKTAVVDVDGLRIDLDWEYLAATARVPLTLDGTLGSISAFETTGEATLTPEARLRLSLIHDLNPLGKPVTGDTKLSKLNQDGVTATIAIEAAAAPASSVLTSDLTFTLQVTGSDNTPHDFTVNLAKFDTEQNASISELRADLGRAVSAALRGDEYAGKVQVELQGGKLVLKATDTALIKKLQLTSPVAALGFTTTTLTSDQPDFQITLRDGTVVKFNLDDYVTDNLKTLGNVVEGINASKDVTGNSINGKLTATVEENHLVLTDTSTGDSAFQVTAVGGSLGGRAGFGLGIVDQTAVQENGQWVIRSADLHSDSVGQHLTIKPLANAPLLTAGLVAQVDNLSATANFGPLEIGIDDSSFGANADVRVSLAAGGATLDQFLGELSQLSAESGTTGQLTYGFDSSANANLKVTSSSFVSSLTDSPEISMTWTDLTDVESLTIGLNNDAQKLADLQNVSTDMIADVLRNVIARLSDELDSLAFLNQAFPGLDRGLGTVLDFDATFSKVLAELDSKRDRSLTTLATVIQSALQKQLTDKDGNKSGSVMVAYSAGKLNVGLTFNDFHTSKFSPEFDFEALGIGNFGSLVDLNGTSQGDITVGVAGNLDFGVDLTDPQSPVPYLGDTTLTVSAGIDADLQFSASLLVLSAAIGNPNGGDQGTLKLTNEAGGDATVTVTLSGQKNPEAPIAFSVTPDVKFEANLPVYLKTVAGVSQIGNDLIVTASVTNNDIETNVTGIEGFVAAVQQQIQDLDLANNFFGSVEGWDQLFSLLDTAVDQNLLNDIPLVGEQLQDSVRFISDLRTKVMDNLNLAGGGTVAWVHQALFDALGGDGVNFGGLGWLQPNVHDSDSGRVRKEDIRILALPAGVTLTDANYATYDVTSNPSLINSATDTVIFDFSLKAGANRKGLELDADLGTGGLGLELDGTVDFKAGFELNLGFGISKRDGVFLYVPDTNAVDTLKLDLDFATKLQAVGKLGFFQLDVKDNGTAFNADFAVDLIDPNNDRRLTVRELQKTKFVDLFDFQGNPKAAAKVDLDLKLSIAGDPSFPSIETGFLLDWSWNEARSAFEFTELGFKDIYLDAGKLISGLVGDTLGTINDVIAPVKPVLDILVDPIPVISDLAGKDITLLDIGEFFGYVSPTTRDFIEAASFISDLVSSAESTGSLRVKYGDSFSLKRSGDGWKESAVDSGGATLSGDSQGLANALKNAPSDDGAGFEVPLLQNPSGALQSTIIPLLLGKDATLFGYNMPALDFRFDYYQDFPIVPPFLKGSVGGEFGAAMDFNFGFDTSGFRSGRVLDGLYVSDTAAIDGSGRDVPEIVLDGALTVTAGPPEIRGDLLPSWLPVSASVTAAAGAGGGVFAEVDFDLNDPDGDGKVYFDELKRNFDLGFDAIFDIDARVWAELFYFIEIGAELRISTWVGSYTKSWTIIDKQETIVDVTLWEKQLHNGSAEEEVIENENPKAAVLQDGVLVLRGTSDDDTLTVTQSDGNVTVTYSDPAGSVVDPVTLAVSDIRRIYFDGGRGNDTVTIDSNITIDAELIGGFGADTLTGGAGNDVIRGDDGNDILSGGAGNDEIHGGLDNDTIDGGAGADSLHGGDGADTIRGGTGDDQLFGDLGNDKLFGDDGNDRLDGGLSNDELHGGRGNDRLLGGGGSDFLYGEDGNDELYAGSSATPGEANAIHTLDGGDGDDVIFGDLGVDNVSGGKGNDQITTFAGNDVIDAGDGDDRVNSGTGSDTVIGGWGSDTIIAGLSDRIDGTRNTIDSNTVYGDLQFGDSKYNNVPGADSAHADIIFTDNGSDFVDGGFGDDRITTFGGSDTIHGGWGADTIQAGITRSGDKKTFDRNVVYGDPLNATTFRGSEEANRDTIYGDAGSDEIHGGFGSDTIFAFSGDNVITGGTGNDRIVTLDGSDEIDAGDGDDDVNSGAGWDTVIGGWGRDRIVAGVAGGAGSKDDHNTVYGDRPDGSLPTGTTPEDHADSIFTDAGVDTVDTVYGGFGSDVITTYGGDDVVYGGSEDDTIDSGDGNDRVYAGTGHDTVTAGAGNDFVEGDLGNDIIDGGDGRDILFGGLQAFLWDALDGNPAASGYSNQFELPAVVQAAENLYSTNQLPINLMPRLVAGASVEGQFDDGRDIIRGGNETDWIFGGGDQDDLDGQGGNDYVDGGANSDLVSGGDGNDLIRGGANDDILHGDRGIDVLLGDAGSDHLFGDAGDETGNQIGQRLFGGDGIDYLWAYAERDITGDNDQRQKKGDQLFGGAGGDWIYGNIRQEILVGEGGNDTILGDYLRGPNYATNPEAATLGASDTIDGGSGEDQLYGGGGRDTIRGGADSDWIEGQDGKDKLYGDAGIDMLVMDTSVSYTEFGDSIDGHFGFGDLASGQDDNATDIVLIEGTSGDDNIRVSEEVVLYSSTISSDTLQISVDSDKQFSLSISPDASFPVTLPRGTYNDVNALVSGLNTQIDSNTELKDQVEAIAVGTGQIAIVRRGAGRRGYLKVSTVDFDGLSFNATDTAKEQLVVDIGQDGGAGKTLLGTWRRSDGTPLVEQFRISGLSGNDTIEFVDGPNRVDVAALDQRSNDFVAVIDGGPGDDTIRGTNARDRLDGGSGSDFVFGMGGDDRVWGDSGNGQASDVDYLFAGQGNDDVIGGQGTNYLFAWSQLPADPLFSNGTDGSVNNQQFGLFQTPAGDLQNSPSLLLNLNSADEIGRFTGIRPVVAPGLSGVSKLSNLSLQTPGDQDVLKFNLAELPTTVPDTAAVTLKHLSGYGVLTIELLEYTTTDGTTTETSIRSASTSEVPEVPEVQLSLRGLTPGKSYGLRISGYRTEDAAKDVLRYQLTPSGFGVSSSQVLGLSLEPEDTGLNRILGQGHQDFLFGGTGLDFLYGNESDGSPDQLYDRRGNLFTSLDGALAGDEWKEYAKQTDKVWYYGGTNLDDVISVDYVTDQDSVLANRHLITRLTGNNGNFTFDAQVQLSFDATDEDGNLIWNPDDVFFDHNLTAALPLRAVVTASDPAPATLADPVSLTLVINAGSENDTSPEISADIVVAATAADSTAADVMEAVNAALADSVLAGQVRAELLDGILQFVLLNGDSLTVLATETADAGAAGPDVLGFAAGQVETTGQLHQDAVFFLSVYGDDPVQVTVTADDTADNMTAADLINDLNAAIIAAGLTDPDSSPIVIAE